MQLSIVIPCLNEQETIARAVQEALSGMQAGGLDGEVVVADNGSTDGSREIAIKAGARVVPVPARGYGAALDGGIRAAQGEVVIFGDADLSYPFSEVGPLAKPVLKGEKDFVLGNRLNNRMEPGAMPTLNRVVGTPVLSFLIRRLYGLPISDCNSGMRAFRRADYEALRLCSPGMEYASEMIIAVARTGLRYGEIELPFRKDRRSKPPHLKRWRDGWRHLRFILAGAPVAWAVTVPALLGLLFMATAFGLSLVEFASPSHRLNFHTAFLLVGLAAPLLVIAVTQVLIRALRHEAGLETHPVIVRLHKAAENSSPFYWSVALFALAFLQGAWILGKWIAIDFGDLFEIGGTIRFVVLTFLATALICLDMSLGMTKIIPFRRS